MPEQPATRRQGVPQTWEPPQKPRLVTPNRRTWGPQAGLNRKADAPAPDIHPSRKVLPGGLGIHPARNMVGRKELPAGERAEPGNHGPWGWRQATTGPEGP